MSERVRGMLPLDNLCTLMRYYGPTAKRLKVNKSTNQITKRAETNELYTYSNTPTSISSRALLQNENQNAEDLASTMSTK